MTPTELEQIQEVIVETVREEMHPQLSEIETQDLALFVSSLSRLGEGNVSTGIEIMIENHKWIYSQRLISKRVVTVVLISILLSILGGMGALIASGFRLFLVKGA